MVSTQEFAGENTAKVTVGRLRVWFVHSTPIAFSLEGALIVRAEGSHRNFILDAIDGGSEEAKAERVLLAEFERRLEGAAQFVGRLPVGSTAKMEQEFRRFQERRDKAYAAYLDACMGGSYPGTNGPSVYTVLARNEFMQNEALVRKFTNTEEETT